MHYAYHQTLASEISRLVIATYDRAFYYQYTDCESKTKHNFAQY